MTSLKLDVLISSIKNDCSPVRRLPACFKAFVAASHTVRRLLSYDSEVELIESSLVKKFLCSDAVFSFYEQFDILRSEFASVNDLEHTLVLLLLRMVCIQKQEYLFGTVVFSEVA